METIGLLKDLAIVLGAALLAGLLCVKLRQPVLVGYLIAGVLIGPHGLGLIRDETTISHLSEIGVILLMFALGVEFSLAQFRPLRWHVLMGGGLSIAGCCALTALAMTALGQPWPRAVLFGFMVALSSTIIVMRVLIDRRAIDSVHGKTMLGWLILQDIAVVPMLVAIPFIAQDGALVSLAGPLLLALGKVVAFLIVMYVLGSRLFPFLLRRVAGLQHKEVFFLAVIGLCFGTAALSASFGLSLALGAFLAGLVVSQSDEHRQVLAEVLPVRDLFVTLFFVSIGMLLNPGFAWTHAPLLAGVVVVIILGKALLGTLIALGLSLSLRSSLLIGLGLAQIGEFSFVLAKEGRSVGLLSPEQFSLALAVALITMLLTPLLMNTAGPLSAVAARFYRSVARDPDAGGSEPLLRDHVLIIGYGQAGQQLGRVLHSRGVPFLVVDLDLRLLRRLKARGYRTLFGDGAMRDVLDHAGLCEARLLVVALPDPSAARLVVAQAKTLRPDLPVIVNTHRPQDAQAFYELGATDVIQPTFEAGVALMRAALSQLSWPEHVIQGYTAATRSSGGEDATEDWHHGDWSQLTQPPGDGGASWLRLGAASPVIGQTLESADLGGRTGVVVLVLRRGEAQIVHPNNAIALEADDALLVLGRPDQLQAALQLLQPLSRQLRKSEI